MASLTIFRRFNARLTTTSKKRAFLGTACLAIVCLLLISTPSGYAQRAQFPLLNGGRIMDGASWRAPKTVERLNSDNSGVYQNSNSAYLPSGNSQTSGSGVVAGGAYPNSAQGGAVSNGATSPSVAVSGRGNNAASSPNLFRTNPQSSNVTPSVDPVSGQRVLPGSRADERAKLLARTRAIPPCLLMTGGQFDFLQVVDKDQVASVATPDDGFLVVVPRKNFLNLAKIEKPADSSDLQNGSASSNSGPIVGLGSPDQLPRESEVNYDVVDAPTDGAGEQTTDASALPDDYVVFRLTNLATDEQNLLNDSKDGRWDYTDLLNASLIAEGLTTNASRAHYRSRFETLLAALKVQTNGLPDQLMKTQRVYDFLHSKTLTAKYNLNCSSVAASLDSGVFNCVSATVLFNCFASRVGLKVAALETTGHAKSRVKFDDSFLDIETTCSSWDRLPDRIKPYAQAKVNQDKVAEAQGQGIPAAVNGVTSDLAKVDALVDKSTTNNSLQTANGGNGTASLQPVSNSKREATGQVQFKPVEFDRDSNSPSLQTASGKNFANLPGEEGKTNVSSVPESKTVSAELGSTTVEIGQETPPGYSYTRTRRPMKEITDVELIATIYYNVGVDHYQSGDYEGAVASYIKAIQLAPDNQTILGNLKATLNNWAIDIAMKEKRYDAAVRITELGMAIDPNYREFTMNMPIYFNDWIEYLAKDNKWDEIKKVQERYWTIFPNERK